VSALVGPNGSGKSAVFDVLQALQQMLGPAGASVHEFFNPFTLTRWDTRTTQRVEIEVDIETDSFTYVLEVSHDPGARTTKIQQEDLRANGQMLYRLSGGEVQLFGDDPLPEPRTRFEIDARRSFIPMLQARADNRRITAFKTWIDRLWLFRLRPEAIAPVSHEEEFHLASDGSNFVSWFRALLQEAPEVQERLRTMLRPIIPGLASMQLSRGGQTDRWMSFRCEVAGQQYTLGLAELSEGQRLLVVLYAVAEAIAQHATQLVFDEPDNFVAESELQPWLSLLRERVAGSGRGSLIVISHHPEVIDYLAADQVLRLWRDDAGPSRVTVLEVDREEGLSASEVLKLQVTG